MQRVGRRRLVAAVGTAVATGLAGCGDGGDESTASASERGPLAVTEFAFTAGEASSFGEYDPRPDATYPPGDTVWLYTELAGVAAEPTDTGDRVEIDLRQHVAVEGPDGQQLLDQEEQYVDRVDPAQLERFYVENDLALAPTAPSGDYAVALSFTDAVSETGADASGTFSVEE